MSNNQIMTPAAFAQLTQNMQEFPLIYRDQQQFMLDGAPSGARGAIANANIPLANAPHLLIGIRLRNVVTVPAADVTTALSRKVAIMQAELDEEQVVRVSLSQQNITVGHVLQPLLVGKSGVNWHPFPIPFGFRGNNVIQVEIRRETAYPIFGEGAVLPTIYIALVTTQFVSDFAPATAPGSTGRP